MKRYDITNKVNGMKFQVERETLEPLQPEWGQPERWVTEPSDDAIETREVLISEAMEVPESVNEETGEIQPGFTTEAVYRTEYKLPADYEIEVTDISERLDLIAESEEALQYLKQTDWYVIRFADSGEPIPENVKQRRAAARERVVKV